MRGKRDRQLVCRRLILLLKLTFVPGGRLHNPPAPILAQPKATKKTKKPRKTSSKPHLSAITAAYLAQELEANPDSVPVDADGNPLGYSQPRNGELTDDSQTDDESDSESDNYHGTFILLLGSPAHLVFL
jgi:hypothetical protein